MDWTTILIGLVVGCIIGYLFVTATVKSKMIHRSKHDEVHSKLQESSTQVKLTDEKLKAQQDLYRSLHERASQREMEMATLLSRTASLETQLKMNNERFAELTGDLKTQAEINRQQQIELNRHQQQVAELNAVNSHMREKLEFHKQEITDIQKTAHLQFEKIAQQIFEEKSGKFTESNKQNIEAILKPLGENIDSFKKKVEETYDKESKQRFALEEKVKDLIENTNKISQEANNLASALKGQVKRQGDWGETILESILEKSGLVRDREYFVQHNLKNEEGQNIRPDVIVKLPDERHIVIDAKVSLNAYSRWSESDIKEQQEIFIAQHLKAMYDHIDQLSGKKYQEYSQSLDFVIMFIPVEPAYMIAIQSDSELWSYAYTRRILLISPTNLIAVLKIIADLWKREVQNKNALAIAIEGTRMYEKLMGFFTTLDNLGKSITKTQESYNVALLQLKDGKGSLISRAEKLKELGVKSAKKLPPGFQSFDPDDDEPMGLPDTDESDGSVNENKP
jgi:DNA recombination protein RmuC